MTAPSWKVLGDDPSAVDDSSDSQSASSDDSDGNGDTTCALHGGLGAPVIKYRPDVDGLRAVAVLSVVTYHLNEALLPGGFTGVDVFFVISGYVVTGSLLGHHGSSASDLLCGFYARRIKRLTPALVVVVGVCGLILARTEPPDIPHLDDYFMAAACGLCGVANVFFAWLSQQGDGGYWDQMTGADRAAANPFVHLWSLGVEEQFYLVFPLLLMLVHRQPHRTSEVDRTGWPTSVVALVACAALSMCVSWGMTERVPDLAFYTLPARFWELAAGAIVAEAEASGNSSWFATWKRTEVLAAQLLALLLLGSGFWFVTPENMGFPFPGAVLPVAGAVCFIVAGASDTSVLNHGILGRAVPVYIGKLSYPLYLWHWPVICLASEFFLFNQWNPVQCVILIFIMLALAAMTYHLVEASFRSWRPPSHRSVFAALLPAALALAAVTLALAYWRDLRRSLYMGSAYPATHLDIEAYELIKTPHVGLPDTGCACTAVPEFLHSPPAALDNSTPDLPSCLDLSGSPAPEECFETFALRYEYFYEGEGSCGGWLCSRMPMCRMPPSDPSRICTREKNTSKAQAEIVARSPCLKPDSDRQKPILLFLGDSHAKALFPGLSLAVRGRFDIHHWGAVQARAMINDQVQGWSRSWGTISWGGVRTELQSIAAAILRPGDVVAFSFYINNPIDRASEEFISSYLGFLEEWSAVVNSTGAALVVFGDPHVFPGDPRRCLGVTPATGPFCFPARGEVRSPVLEALAAQRGWLYFGVQDKFCNRKFCSPFIPDTDYVAYKDEHHLNPVGASYLAPFICAFFRERGLFDRVR